MFCTCDLLLGSIGKHFSGIPHNLLESASRRKIETYAFLFKFIKQDDGLEVLQWACVTSTYWVSAS